MKIFLLQPETDDSSLVYEFVLQSARMLDLSVNLETFHNLQYKYLDSKESISKCISESDLIIGNMDGGNVSVVYGLSIASSMKKPLLLIYPSDRAVSIPEAFAKSPQFVFSLSSTDTFYEGLKDQIELIISGKINNVKSVFISYSHKDAEYLQRLLVHLKPLERSGSIDLWVDTKIKSSQVWKKEIEDALVRSKIAILLISADFMASDFIVDNELPPLLDKANKEGMDLLILVLKPCRFLRDSNLSKYQAVIDPSKPLISLSEYEREMAYDKLAGEIEASIQT